MKHQASPRHEAFYESLFDSMLDGLAYCQMFFDAQGLPVDFTYVEVNKNFERLTGLKDAVGKKVTELIPGVRTSNPELFEIFGRVSLTGVSERFETYIESLTRWFLVSVYSPKKNFFVAILQNITDRKWLEKDLESAKVAARNVLEDLVAEKEKIAQISAKDEAILASIADGCIAVNEDGTIFFINQMAQNLLGYASEESIGKKWYEILHRQDENGNAISAEEGAIHKALYTTTTTTTTTTTSSYYLRKDRTRFPVSRTVSPITLHGKVTGAVNIFRDVTRERELDREKSEFVSLAAHQLRTPITGIEWTVELLLRKEKLTEKERKYLNDIHFSAQRLNTLVKLLLNVSRIESGKVAVETGPVELVAFIDACLREHQVLCEKKKLIIVFSEHPQKLMVTTDKNLLDYILKNLLGNAIQYTQEGGRVEVTAQEQQNSVLVTVQDTGIGIPKKEQARIFGKFIRASNAVNAKPDGTGLGLYIVQESVHLLGGNIRFESEEGRGSTFFVELPLVSPSRAGEKGLVLQTK